MNEPYFKESDQVCNCKDCKTDFKAYYYWEDCSNCNDGETYEGDECRSCGGSGTHDSFVKDICQDCLYIKLTRE